MCQGCQCQWRGRECPSLEGCAATTCTMHMHMVQERASACFTIPGGALAAAALCPSVDVDARHSTYQCATIPSPCDALNRVRFSVSGKSMEDWDSGRMRCQYYSVSQSVITKGEHNGMGWY